MCVRVLCRMWVMLSSAGLFGWLVYCRGSRGCRGRWSPLQASQTHSWVQMLMTWAYCAVSLANLWMFLRRHRISWRRIEDCIKNTSQLICRASQNMSQMPSGPADFLQNSAYLPCCHHRHSWHHHLCPVVVLDPSVVDVEPIRKCRKEAQRPHSMVGDIDSIKQPIY